MSKNIIETDDLVLTRLIGPLWVGRTEGNRTLYQITARATANDARLGAYVTLTKREAEQLCRGLAADLGLGNGRGLVAQ